MVAILTCPCGGQKHLELESILGTCTAVHALNQCWIVRWIHVKVPMDPMDLLDGWIVPSSQRYTSTSDDISMNPSIYGSNRFLSKFGSLDQNRQVRHQTYEKIYIYFTHGPLDLWTDSSSNMRKHEKIIPNQSRSMDLFGSADLSTDPSVWLA